MGNDRRKKSSISTSKYVEPSTCASSVRRATKCATWPGTGPSSVVGNASDSRARDSGFDTRFGHTLSFFLSLIQEGQLSVTGGSMCTKYWLTA